MILIQIPEAQIIDKEMTAMAYLLPSTAGTALSHLYCKFKKKTMTIRTDKEKAKTQKMKMYSIVIILNNTIFLIYSSSFHNDQCFEVSLEVYYPETHDKLSYFIYKRHVHSSS